jgi:hypothetical protein
MTYWVVWTMPTNGLEPAVNKHSTSEHLCLLANNVQVANELSMFKTDHHLVTNWCCTE